MTKALGPVRAQEMFLENVDKIIDGHAKFLSQAQAGDTFTGLIEIRIGFEGDSDTNLGGGVEVDAVLIEGVADAELEVKGKRQKKRSHDNDLLARVEITSVASAAEEDPPGHTVDDNLG